MLGMQACERKGLYIKQSTRTCILSILTLLKSVQTYNGAGSAVLLAT